MQYRKKLMYFLLIFTGFKVWTQNNFNSLGETSLIIKHKVSQKYNADFTFRNRYILYNQKGFKYVEQQVDVFHFSTFKLNTNYNLTAGVYYRNRDVFDTGSNELRFLQQLSYKKQKTRIRYQHRFRTEQRILNTQTIFRQRYKFAINYMLIKKTYIINAIEGLLSINKARANETDLRFSTQIGWQITQALKLQTGVEHRLEAFNLTAKNNLYLLTSAVLKI